MYELQVTSFMLLISRLIEKGFKVNQWGSRLEHLKRYLCNASLHDQQLVDIRVPPKFKLHISPFTE